MPATHLVVVCCHGIWVGGPAKGHDESEWLIADFQAGETPTFIEHIKAGLQAARDDSDAIVVYSGAPTRKETRLSEARSYLNLASANNYFGLVSFAAESAGRILIEEQALDSYHNILFSLVTFWRRCGAWPSRVTIVSHEFKRERIDGHCTAIGFPISKIELIGIDPPSMIPSEKNGEVPKTGAMHGVRHAVNQWAADPHGTGDVLASKRAKRNPWAIAQTIFESDEERQRSGLGLYRTDYGGETLIDDAPRPWIV